MSPAASGSANVLPSTMNNQLGPTPPTERLDVIDALRGLAIGGILFGNMQWFSGYGFMPAFLAAEFSGLDKAVHFAVHFLVEGKFYSIFSFLFGFGFALQMARAEVRGDAGASLFKRRLFWLLVIGLLHAYLLWAGDILSIYAVMGFVLILFRRKPDRSLLKWAAGLMIVPVLSYLLLFALFKAFVSPEALAQFETGQSEFWREMSRRASEGTYLEIVTGFNLNYVAGRYAGLIFDMRLPKILAMFLLGLYAFRRGFFQNVEANLPFIRRVMTYGLGVGLAANLIFAAVAGKEAVFPPTAAGILGVVLYAVGVPALALGIAALVAILWQSVAWRRPLALLAPVGRMALTNYIMQTVVCVLIFYGYGLGQFGKVGPTTATLLAAAIFAGQVVLSTVWLRSFKYGPLEWIWRQLTYGRRLPLRSGAAAAETV